MLVQIHEEMNGNSDTGMLMGTRILLAPTWRIASIALIASQLVACKPSSLRGDPDELSPLQKLEHQLGHRDLSVSARAVTAAGNLGAKAAPLVPALARALRRGDYRFKTRIAVALGEIGPGAASSVPALRTALKAAESLVIEPTAQKAYFREAAARALGRIGPGATAAIADLVRLLNDPSSSTQEAAIAALVAMGAKANPGLAGALKAKDAIARRNCARALALIGKPAEPSIPDLVETLDDSEVAVAEAAGKALSSIGKKAVAQLIRALDHSSSRVRALSCVALGEIGPDAAGAVKKLVERLKDADARTRNASSAALGAVGPVALRPLLTALDDRESAAGALGAIEALATAADWIAHPDLKTSVLKKITVLLRHEDPEIRAGAASTLEEFKHDASTAALALAKLLRDPVQDVRNTAAFSLRAIGFHAAPALPAMLKAVTRERDTFTQSIIIAALGAVGSTNAHADKVRPTLVSFLKHEHYFVRFQAVKALDALDLEMHPAISSMVPLIADPDPRVAQAAMESLAGWGSMAKEAIPLLIGRLIYYCRNSLRAAKNSDFGCGLPAALGDKSISSAVKAAHVLGRIGKGDEGAARALQRLLSHSDIELRRAGAVGLCKMGLKAALPAVPLLLNDLEDQDAEVRMQAAEVLAELGGASRWSRPMPPAAKVTSVLVSFLGDRSAGSRLRATSALLDVGPGAVGAVGPLLHTLKDDDAEVRRAAFATLKIVGKSARSAVPSVIALLQDKDKRVRADATMLLGTIGSGDPRAIRALVDLIKAKEGDTNAHRSMREMACRSIAEMGEDAASAIPDLVQLLQRGERLIGLDDALGGIGPQAIPELKKALAHENPRARYLAASALWQMGDKAAPAVDALALALEDQSYWVRLSAAGALQNIGDKALPAVRALVDALRDQSEGVRSKAAATLTRIAAMRDEHKHARLGPLTKRAVGALVQALNDERREPGEPPRFGGYLIGEKEPRASAAWALGAIGEDAAPAVPDLIRSLTDLDSDLRWASASALGDIRVDTGGAIKPLVRLLRDKEGNVRGSAARALGRIAGKDLGAVVSALIRALRDSEADVRVAAARALGELGNQQQQVVGALLVSLRKNDHRLRAAAAEAIGWLGKRTPALIAALDRATKDEDETVRRAASEALAKLRR